MADGLRSTPLEGNLFILCDVEWFLDVKQQPLRDVILISQKKRTKLSSVHTYLDHSGQSKVGHLTDVVSSYQDIPCCQVPVDAVVLLQIRHPISHLGAHVNEGCSVLKLPLWT